MFSLTNTHSTLQTDTSQPYLDGLHGKIVPMLSSTKYRVRDLPQEEFLKDLTMYSDFLRHLLVHRGITSSQEAYSFLNPDYSKLHDPSLLQGADKAAERIINAIEKGEKIVIYSDYDADGIPAGVIFHDFLKRVGYSNFSNYIPHRHDEGFGLNVDAIDLFVQDKVSLIVTLDCGISDIEAVRKAQESGIDVIITDHHEPHEELPPAYAIVDHKQRDCLYPEKILCGSGVGFKLIQAVLKKKRFEVKEGHEKWLLDMVGIATLSDMVPLVGENRILSYYGLMVLRKSPRKGLMRLLSHLKIDQRYLTEDDVGFMITPRINAASRMGVPMDAFKLLSTDDDTEAHIHVEHLDKINNERKGTVAALVKEVKKLIHERYGDNPRSVIVAGNPEWRPSLLGLVANTLAEEFNRPAFLWGRDGDNVIKGSCRSGGTTSVVAIMNKVEPGVFTQYGGHAASGGFAVAHDAIHHLDDHLNSAFDLLGMEERDAPLSHIDMELSLERVTWDTFRDIDRLAPFGVGNPKPVFLFRNIKIYNLKPFGKEKNHLELQFQKENGSLVTAIGFFMSTDQFVKEDESSLSQGDTISLVASMEKSNFRGRPELRLRIIDILYS